jgi:hypothetical protein
MDMNMQYLARAPAASLNSEALGQNVILVGASNLKYNAKHFSDANMTFRDISSPGWVANPSNISGLCAAVEKEVQEGAKAFVFDLLGNSAIRYEQYDGTTSLPYKSQGRFHLQGNAVISPPGVFQKTIDSIVPILTARQQVPCLIIPPIPIYLFARCCDDPAHCTNWNVDSFPAELLSGFISLRLQFIKSLTRLQITNFRVLDSCCTTTCTSTSNTVTRISELRKVTAKDGIHFIEQGYKNLAENCVASLRTLLSSNSERARGGVHKSGVFFWRGFRSPTPAGASSSSGRGFHSRGIAARGIGRGCAWPGGRGYGYHPYNR